MAHKDTLCYRIYYLLEAHTTPHLPGRSARLERGLHAIVNYAYDRHEETYGQDSRIDSMKRKDAIETINVAYVTNPRLHLITDTLCSLAWEDKEVEVQVMSLLATHTSSK